MERIKVGVIGLGWFGEVHCNTLSAIPNLQLAALCDVDAGRLEELAGRFGGAATYTDYHALLASDDIDVVHIVTRWEQHAEHAIAALEAGKHVFLEKPMAPSVEECAAICDAAKKAKGFLMVGHVCRFNPRYAMAKGEIAAGKIGKVVALSARRNIPAAWSEALLDKASPISDTGIHDTDLLLWLSDSRAVSVYAQTVDVSGRKNPDVVQIMYRFANGATATYESVWCMPETSPFVIDERMSVIGSEGFVHVQDTFPNLGIASKDGFISPDTTYWPELHGAAGGALREEFMYFARCVSEGLAPTVITPEESMAAIETVLAAERSARTGEIVRLD